MSIRAVFPSGWSEITVHGLHQWDYGQTLEIQADDLPAIVEVHFACQGMKDAPVRVCNAVSGVATAAIPDICLEQNTTVTAWIYEVGETSGRTIKTISLPIIARARPQSVETVPAEDFSDQYTEALAAFNAAADTLKTGAVTVARAVNAGHADSATSADKATTAEGVTINGKAPFQAPTENITALPSAGYYSILASIGVSIPTSFLVYWDGSTTTICGIVAYVSPSAETVNHLLIEANGNLKVLRFIGDAEAADRTSEYKFKCVKLWG